MSRQWQDYFRDPLVRRDLCGHRELLIHMQEVRAQSKKPTCVGQASIIECGDLEIVVWKFNRVAHSADNWLNADVDHCQSLKLSDLSSTLFRGRPSISDLP
jgi:hypothetical protein